jgi:hypothetical protein
MTRPHLYWALIAYACLPSRASAGVHAVDEPPRPPTPVENLDLLHLFDHLLAPCRHCGSHHRVDLLVGPESQKQSFAKLKRFTGFPSLGR